jgi:phosphatidylglycerol:prolipoprotein diacylglycerol transferase
MLPYIYIVLPSYLLMAFIGGMFALLYTFFRLEKFNVLFTDMFKIFIACVIGGFIGGKALYVITQTPQLINNFSLDGLIHLVIHSGVVFYGGLFGVLLAIKLYTKLSRYNENSIFRMVAPAIPLFHGFGRIGCLLAGCCYGKELGGSFELLFGLSVDRVPVQLIEAVFEFALFFVLRGIGKKHPEQNLLKVYLVTYAAFRFILEFFRGDVIRGIYLGLSTAQWISLAILTYYFVKTIHMRIKKDECEIGMVKNKWGDTA